MDTDPHDTRSGMVLVLGLGFLNWLLNDEKTDGEDQIAFGDSADAGYRAEDTEDRQASERSADVRPDGVRFEAGKDSKAGTTVGKRHTGNQSKAPDQVEESPVHAEDDARAVERTTESDGPSPPEGRATAGVDPPVREEEATEARSTGDTPRAEDEETDESAELSAAELDARITEIESEIDRLSQTVETLDRDFDSLQSSLGTIETDLERLISQAEATLTDQLQRDEPAEDSPERTDASGDTDPSPESVTVEKEPVDNRSTSTPGDTREETPSAGDVVEERDSAGATGPGRSRRPTSRRAIGATGTDSRRRRQTDALQDSAEETARSPVGDGGADVTSTTGRDSNQDPEVGTRESDKQMHSPPDDSPTESDRSQRPNEDTAETDAWPPEADDDSSTIETGGAPEVSSTISEVTSKVSEEMGQIVDGEEAPNSLAEPAATVVGTEQRSDDPLTDDVDEEQTAADADDLSVEDIDQLLESDDWAVEIDDIEIDEDAPLEGVLEEEEDFLDEETDVIDEHNGGDEDAPLGEGQDTVETDAGALDELDLENDEVEEEGTEDEPAGQSTDGHAADPARLAESAAPAEAMRTYVEEGNPEATSVEPESTAGAFEFGKVLMPNDDEPDLPELVGADVEKPYLEALPKGYATDSLAIEWMGWLVNEGDAASAVDLVLYYEEAGWLGERATDDLLAYLEGLVDLGDAPSNGSLETYDLETHLHGLEYIKEISEDPTLSEVTTDGV